MFRHACKLGLEGIVSKRRDAPYRSGRPKTWLKRVEPLPSRMSTADRRRRPRPAGRVPDGCNRGAALAYGLIAGLIDVGPHDGRDQARDRSQTAGRNRPGPHHIRRPFPSPKWGVISFV
jgi:hypothetical protein